MKKLFTFNDCETVEDLIQLVNDLSAMTDEQYIKEYKCSKDDASFRVNSIELAKNVLSVINENYFTFDELLILYYLRNSHIWYFNEYKMFAKSCYDFTKFKTEYSKIKKANKGNNKDL